MSAEKRIVWGACLLSAGIVVGCVQAWLAVTGRAPVVSGLSLLALALGGAGACLMLTSCDVVEVPVVDAELAALDAALSSPAPAPGAGGGGVGEDALAQAARIVDGAVADEAEAVVERLHSQPHAHLRLVLGHVGDSDGEDADGEVPEMVCELVAPDDAMGLAVGALASLMSDPHRVRGLLEHLASDGDASAVRALAYLSDGGEQR
ncbi:hypothetical protein CWT12_06595 [Actinomyces sp. 432]|uniref:hypothetical protein n=1 Tax=Actinomyces sp. 432 TaxID=2057798 RepID=UPI0013739691|nr:hypothetical protein [Actinomyces sp. 432]QHO91057.1 hypothetical protein CWT12_06595 [Actinomyces sp. 432]